MAGSVAAVAAVGVAVAALRRHLRVVTVIGMSMAPTYAPGERVLVRRVPARALRRGQVVVFEEPDGAGDGPGGWPRSPAGPDAAEDRLAAPSDGQAAGPPGWMIKRVAAVPGDPVPRTLTSVLGEASDAVVPANRFAVLGDNPSGSFDSRKFGYVPGDRVLGVAVRRLHIRGRHPVLPRHRPVEDDGNWSATVPGQEGVVPGLETEGRHELVARCVSGGEEGSEVVVHGQCSPVDFDVVAGTSTISTTEPDPEGAAPAPRAEPARPVAGEPEYTG